MAERPPPPPRSFDNGRRPTDSSAPAETATGGSECVVDAFNWRLVDGPLVPLIPKPTSNPHGAPAGGAQETGRVSCFPDEPTNWVGLDRRI